MAQKTQNSEVNIFRAAPWIVLIVLIATVYFNLPSGDNATVTKAGTSQETTSTTSTAPPVPARVDQVKVLDVMNLRSRPSLSEKTLVGVVGKGTIVKVLERRDKWLKVRLSDGRGGYIANDPKYVSREGSP